MRTWEMPIEVKIKYTHGYIERLFVCNLCTLINHGDLCIYIHSVHIAHEKCVVEVTLFVNLSAQWAKSSFYFNSVIKISSRVCHVGF